MKLTDHIHIIWPERPFVARGDVFEFDDGLPMPTQAELDATYDQALALYEAKKQQDLINGIVVSMRSFREACGRELMIQINAYVASIEDLNERFRAQTDLEFATTVARSHPRVAQFAAALNKTDAEIDDVFINAQQLDAA
jgi:hypothetical protein